MPKPEEPYYCRGMTDDQIRTLLAALKIIIGILIGMFLGSLVGRML
jgi:hypothetical protein